MFKHTSNRSFLGQTSVSVMTLLAILATTIFLPTHVAHASTPSYSWSSWELRVDFPASGTTNAIFIVRVGHHVPDGSGGTKQVVDILHEAPIPCTPQGDVTIDPGIATFHNTPASPGHILCTLPDYAATVDSLTGGLYTIGSSVNVSKPWITALLTPVPNDGHPGPVDPTENPVFYHPEIQLSTPSGVNPGTVHLHYGFDGGHVTSDLFSVGTAWHSIWAGPVLNEVFFRTDFWTWATYLNPGDLIGLGGLPLVVDGKRLGVISSSSGSTFPISTGSTTICIGCNLDAGTFFEGTIHKLSVDPPNLSNH